MPRIKFAAVRYSKHGVQLVLVLLPFLATAQSHAQLVLYDGAVGDANPVTQGWDLLLNPDPSIATVTPDPTNDVVHMKKENDFVGNPEDPRDLQYSLPLNLQSLQGEVADDSYHWRLKFKINEFIFMGFPTGSSRHTLADFNFQTGTDSGSAGYYERLFIGPAGIRFPISSAIPNFRPDFAFEPTGIFIRPTDAPGSPPEVDISPNWNSMLEMNEVTLNRVGNRVEMYVNGDFIFSGYGRPAAGSTTQVYLNDNSDSQRVDMDWARFEVGDALPMVVTNPPAPEVLYDGSYFGGDPIKQGWLVEPLSPGLILTPDDQTDSVRIESSGSPYRLKIPFTSQKAYDETNDDFYRWSMTFSVNEESHQSTQVKFTGGVRRETIQIEGNQIIVTPSVNPAVPGVVPMQAVAGFDMIISPGETPHFTSMSDVNKLDIYRKGDEVFMTINGDIVFRGVGALQDLEAGQLTFDEGEAGISDFNLYAVSVGSALEGDYDADNDVDEDDYDLWKLNFGTLVPFNPSQEIYRADGNRNGVIDAADYVVWRNNVGMTLPLLGLTVPASGATTAIPEPNGYALALLAIAIVAGRRRWRGLLNAAVVQWAPTA